MAVDLEPHGGLLSELDAPAVRQRADDVQASAAAALARRRPKPRRVETGTGSATSTRMVRELARTSSRDVDASMTAGRRDVVRMGDMTTLSR
jgi:hypothetical protein